MAQKHLIVNADDFGENSATNAAIILAHEKGIVTSASLIVTGGAVAEAVDLAREHPNLRVGLHVVLVHGKPALSPQEIPGLIEANGRFPENAPLAGLRWYCARSAREQIRREIWAQVERFQQTGLPLDHINAHLHFHVHPAVFDVLMEVAEQTGVRRIRLPWEPWWISLRIDASHLLRKVGYIFAFGLLARVYRPRLRAAGIFFPGAVFGILQTGEISEHYLVHLLHHLPHGVSELYAHPRLDTTAGLKELHALTSPRVREVMAARNIRLTTYTEAFSG